jgi:uncharacterized protein (DUF1810 family)
MTDAIQSDRSGDTFDLNRFVQAQDRDYDRALAEIRSGRKRSHWMWYIFPQFDGLGLSAMSKQYAIKSLAEAEAYLKHSILGPRLVECCEAVLGVQGRTATEVFGSVDEMKLKSCATLFACVSTADSAFQPVLEKYFDGERVRKTLRLLGFESKTS